MSDSQAPTSEIVLYQTEDGRTRIDVRTSAETVWLSQDQMAKLFQRDKSVISRHISNVFSEGELLRDSVVADFATTAADGNSDEVGNVMASNRTVADYATVPTEVTGSASGNTPGYARQRTVADFAIVPLGGKL